jgi:hypothetical protein
MSRFFPLVLVCFAMTAHAGLITYNTASGATAGGESVSASAVFNITDANHFTITLNNTIGSISDAGQLLTDLEFKLAGTVTYLSSSGNFVNIDSSGNASSAGSGATGWIFGNDTTAHSWLLCVICGDGFDSGTNNGTIVGNGPYSSANSSINGNSGHNPFLLNGATFNFSTGSSLPLDGSNPFSSVVFSFSTAFGVDSPGTTDGGGNIESVAIPEPATMSMVGGALLAAGFFLRRRK